MQFQSRALKVAVGGFLLVGALAVQAASTDSTVTYTLPSPFWVSDSSNNGSAAFLEHNFTLANTKFDSAVGVLTAAPVTLSTRGLLSVESTSSGAAGEAWLYMEARMLGSYAYLSGLPFVSVAGEQQRISLVGTSQALPVGNDLSSFVGTDTVASQVYLGLIVEKTAGGSGVFSSSVVGRLDARPFVTTQTINYSYLQHANASFEAGADTNSLTLSVGPGTTPIEVFALAGSLGAAETTRLDATTLQCMSGCSDFNVAHLSVQDLLAGRSASVMASLMATAPGTYTAQYLLTFADDAAVGVGQQQNTLTLNLTGTVAAVPEPGSWGLMLAGLVSVAFVVCRKSAAPGR